MELQVYKKTPKQQPRRKNGCRAKSKRTNGHLL